MRGEDLSKVTKALRVIRNTSTCVEKTGVAPLVVSAAWKHLHMRGEDIRVNPYAPSATETPPHAWRRQLLNMIMALQMGNTSTCVEKTLQDQWQGI